MRRVDFTPAASRDLDGIWSYSLERWGADRAIGYIIAIRHGCEAVASGRTHGRPVPVRDGILCVKLGSHVAFYRMEPHRIAVIRILHERQDVGRHL